MFEKPHKRLECWKLAIDFVEKIYKCTNAFPAEEKFGLTSQLRRASVSIAANIAEGAGRKSNKEFLNFLSMSMGSVSEVDTLLTIAERLGFIGNTDNELLLADLNTIGKLVYGLMNKVRTTVN